MKRETAGPYELFMLALCVYVLGALGAQTFLPLDPDVLHVLDTTDTAVCAVFFADFVRSLVLAEDRRRYLVTWGWIDFISSIPAIDVFRWGRAARVFRVLRVFRGLRATRILAGFALERRAASAFWSALLFALLATVFGSIAIVQLERPAGGNIQSASDSLWWAFVTLTTVGYGDHYPVTPSGRILAAVLMAIGIGLFGTLTAFVASAFLSTGESDQARELEALRDEVRALREELRRSASDR